MKKLNKYQSYYDDDIIYDKSRRRPSEYLSNNARHLTYNDYCDLKRIAH